MTLNLIDKELFESLSYKDDVYFCNGCLFLDDTDKLIAFPVYDSHFEEPSAYYEVVYE